MITELEEMLCKRYTLDPFALDERRAVEVFKRIKYLNAYIDRNEKDNQEVSNDYTTDSKGNGKTRYRVKVTDS